MTKIYEPVKLVVISDNTIYGVHGINLLIMDIAGIHREYGTAVQR